MRPILLAMLLGVAVLAWLFTLVSLIVFWRRHPGSWLRFQLRALGNPNALREPEWNPALRALRLAFVSFILFLLVTVVLGLISVRQ